MHHAVPFNAPQAWNREQRYHPTKSAAKELPGVYVPHAPVNLAAVAITFLVPPLIFLFTASPLSFSPHFNMPYGVWLIVSVSAIPGLIALRLWYKAVRNSMDPTWYAFSAFVLWFAFVAGCLFGDQNYWYATQRFYAPEAMKTYPNLDPAKTNGIQIMDAGRAYFKEGTRLDVDKGMAFTHNDVYCIAPIVHKDSELEYYDLWAVGKNCCSTADPQFNCDMGTGKNIKRAGLRAVEETDNLIWSQRGDEQLYYRLAVSMAEAAYNIKSMHPIFFHWVQDPDAETMRYFEVGYKLWILGCGLHFGVNTFFLAAFLLMFNKSFHGHR